jgi:hypothetical protein
MFQFLGVILILIIIKLLMDNFKPSLKSNPGKKSDVIDVTGKWIDTDDMPYQKNEYLLSDSELTILKTLSDILFSTRYVVFPHVRLADLLQVPPQTPNRQEYLFRIKERSVDMAIFDAAYLKPVLVINLIDSNPASKRPGTDQFTKAALQTAGLSSLSIDLGNIPARDELERLLRDRGLTL